MGSRYLISDTNYIADLSPWTNHTQIYNVTKSFEELVKCSIAPPRILHYQAENRHYNDVIMSAMASQITSLTIVYLIVYSGVHQRNIKVPRHWSLCGVFTGTGEFPAQMASNAENVSIWWRHHETWVWDILCSHTYHNVVVIYFYDDQRWVIDNGLRVPLNDDVIEHQDLVPGRTQRLVNHKCLLALVVDEDTCKRVWETWIIRANQVAALVQIGTQFERLFLWKKKKDWCGLRTR